MSSLKVLHVSTWGVPCGIASYCANLVHGLQACGVDSEVFALEPQNWQSYLPGDVPQLLDGIVRQSQNCDVVHIQHEHAFFGYSKGTSYAAKRYGQLLRELRSAGKTVITTFHTEPSPGTKRVPKYLRNLKNGLRHWKWKRHVSGHFKTAIGGARAIVHTRQSRFALAQAGISPEAIHVLPHACPAPRTIGIDRASARTELGLAPDDCLLTIFGFIGYYKGHDLAVRALKHLPPEYHLAIVGGAHPESRDSFLNRLLARVDDSLRDRVKITGYVDQATANLYFAATDICLAPYRDYANLSASGAITWALSSGRPTIASKIDAFLAIQRQADCLNMVTPGAVRELAWAAQTLHQNPSRQRQLVSSAHDYCLEHTWEDTAAATIAVYEQALGRQLASVQYVNHKAAA